MLSFLEFCEEADNDNPDETIIRSQISSAKKSLMKIPAGHPAGNVYRKKIEILSGKLKKN